MSNICVFNVRRCYRTIAYSIAVFCTFFCEMAFSHVRWFTDDSVDLGPTSFSLDFYSVFIVTGALLYVVICFVMQRTSEVNASMHKWLRLKLPSAGFEWRALKTAIAILLIGNIALDVFFAPNLVDERISSTVLILTQAIILALLVFDDAMFSLALAIAIFSLFCFFSILECADYFFEFMAVAIAVFISGKTRAISHYFSRRGMYVSREMLLRGASSVIRVGVGIQLIVLAVHNKLAEPSLALSFINDYSYFNFMPALGFSEFSHLHFVLAAGVVEFCFGTLLIFNVAGRFVAASVTFFFSATSVIIGVHEFVGHVPMIACLAVVIVTPGDSVFYELKSLKRYWGLWRNVSKGFASNTGTTSTMEISGKA